jgi:hypothetical protein
VSVFHHQVFGLIEDVSKVFKRRERHTQPPSECKVQYRG